MSTAVHTPAPAPCLPGFELSDAAQHLAAPESPRVAFTGVLARAAEVRCKPVGDGAHTLPVLCLELVAVGPGMHSVHAEQIFTEATRPQAEALARRLHKGATVTVRTSLLDMRLTLPHVELCEPERTPS